MKKIIAYKDYFLDFMSELVDNEKDRINRALLLLESEDKLPSHLLDTYATAFLNIE